MTVQLGFERMQAIALLRKGNMAPGLRQPRLAPIEIGLALAALVCASAADADVRGLRLPAPALFADIAASPLLAELNAPIDAPPPSSYAQAIDVLSVGMGAFQRLADRRALTALLTHSRPAPAASAPTASTDEPAAPPGAPSSQTAEPAAQPAAIAPESSAASDPGQSAIFAALVRLIARDDAVDPLGAGDWSAARAAIGAFYAARGFRPIWVDASGLTPAGRSASDRIARGGEDGLTLHRVAVPRNLEAPLGPDALAAAEVAVAASVVAYAEQASGSRLDQRRLTAVFAAAPQIADPGEALAETADAPDPGARLAAFNPPQKGYRALKEALNRLVGESAALRPDATRLVAGAVSDSPDAALDPFAGARRPGKGRTRALVASVAPNREVKALARRRATILANMEMWRWEPRDMGERRIEVNIPDFSVTVTDGEAILMSSRVVVGKPATPTPVFSDRMRYVLINPAWQVPDSIVNKEILPRLEHFEALGYEVRTVGGRLVVRQPPGDDNALGRLAFMFPNSIPSTCTIRRRAGCSTKTCGR